MGRREWKPVCLFLLHSRSFRQSVTRSLAAASYMWGTSRSATCYHARKQWHERGACAQRCREGGSVPSACSCELRRCCHRRLSRAHRPFVLSPNVVGGAHGTPTAC